MKTAVNIILQANFIIHRSWLFTGYSSGFVKSRIYFASSQAVVEMYTRSGLLNKLFLFKGKTTLCQLSVRIPPA